jgi:hypothetical protein
MESIPENLETLLQSLASEARKEVKNNKRVQHSSGQIMRLLLDAKRTEQGYRGAEVSVGPSRTEEAYVAAVLALHGEEIKKEDKTRWGGEIPLIPRPGVLPHLNGIYPPMPLGAVGDLLRQPIGWPEDAYSYTSLMADEDTVLEEAMDNLKEAEQRIRATQSLMRSEGMTDGENYRDFLTRLSTALAMTEAAYLEARRQRDL